MLSLLLIQYKEVDYFPGNWTSTIIRKEKEINETAHFAMFMEKRELNISNITAIPCFGSFKNTSNLKIFPPLNSTYIALKDPANFSRFLLMHIEYMLPITTDGYTEILSTIFKKNNISDFSNFENIVSILENETMVLPGNISVYAFDSYFVNATNQTHPFALNRSIIGTQISHKMNETASFIGSLFDMTSYIIEGKKYGVVAALSAVLSTYAWRSLLCSFKSEVSLQSLSMTSFLMQISSDFGHSLLILEIGMTNYHFFAEYLAIFIAFISVYFYFQMSLLLKIWKAQGFFIDANRDALRQEFLNFFTQVTFLLSFSSLTVSLALEYPIICLPYVYFSFIPQIIKSAKTPGKKSGDEAFTIFSTISRLLPLWYFTLYPKNINGTISIPICIIFTVYAALQVIIIILQNKFGGSFFLPRKYRPAEYDYYSPHVEPGTECSICMANIEEGDETMTTPCGHSFHRECLERWMQERLICPMDRTPLPPIPT